MSGVCPNGLGWEQRAGCWKAIDREMNRSEGQARAIIPPDEDRMPLGDESWQGRKPPSFPYRTVITGSRGALPWVIPAWKAYVDWAASGHVDSSIP